jgi:hypothetical protein
MPTNVEIVTQEAGVSVDEARDVLETYQDDVHLALTALYFRNLHKVVSNAAWFKN